MARKFLALVAFSVVAVVFSATAKAATVGGPKGTEDRIDGYQTIVYHANFYGNEIARVGLIGDGDSDIDLYVYDENGNLIDSDTDSTDQCLTSWVPKWTGRFTIKVVNRGSIPNDFVLRTN